MDDAQHISNTDSVDPSLHNNNNNKNLQQNEMDVDDEENENKPLKPRKWHREWVDVGHLRLLKWVPVDNMPPQLTQQGTKTKQRHLPDNAPITRSQLQRQMRTAQAESLAMFQKPAAAESSTSDSQPVSESAARKRALENGDANSDTKQMKVDATETSSVGAGSNSVVVESASSSHGSN